MADVVVIGGGITGTAMLYELAKYNLKTILVEKNLDISSETTKANSAILHAGFDAKSGSNKAKMNVLGNRLYHELKDELDLDIKWLGSYVCATTEEEEQTLNEIFERGKTNGVPDLKIISGDELRATEKNLSKNISKALFAPTAGLCFPFDLACAFAENAELNGAEILRDCEVTAIETENNRVKSVITTQGKISCRYVVNAAGLYADKISKMVGDESFTIKPRKGEYILFDKTAQKDLVQGIIFPTPTKISKGILVCATTHGNTFIGPNAQNQDSVEDTSVTQPGLDEIMQGARKLIDKIPNGLAITEFAGIRAASSTGDFVLGESKVCKGFLQAAGIESPGLTSAPAIAKFLTQIILDETKAQPKENYHVGRPKKYSLQSLSEEELNELIKKDSRFGRIICRCESVTEGEIVDAIHRPCGARTVDGVKRRTRAGMGRCQGGFCSVRVIEILARELNITIPEVRKEEKNSQLYFEKL